MWLDAAGELALAAIVGLALTARYYSRRATRAEAAYVSAEQRTANAHEYAQSVDDLLRAAAANVQRLREEVATLSAPKPALTAAEVEAARAGKCTHCGGVHSISCPRVKRLRFQRDGSPLEVEYWDTWPRDRVLFLEDYLEPTPSEDHPALPEQTEAR